MITTSPDKNIQDYAAKTAFTPHKIKIPFVNEGEIVPVGLDVGYSATKVYGIFGSYIFPSFPIRVSDDFALVSSETDIRYRDENGRLWYVGDLARSELESGRVQAQSEILFGRQRITSDEYLVLLRVGLFFALIDRDLGDKMHTVSGAAFRITTGLPDQYLDKFRMDLKNRFIGHHHFEVKIGGREWGKVSFDIDEEDITVLSQPFGTLFSLAYNRFGELVAPDLIRKSVLFFDGGQRTVDTYHNRANSKKGTTATWEDLSMIEVIKRTISAVKENTDGQGAFPDYSFDKLVLSKEPGTVVYGRRQVYDFSKDVFAFTQDVAKEAIRQLDNLYDNLNDIDVLICTGGAGKAYFEYVKQAYQGFEGLEVLLSEKTDGKKEFENFSSVFANAVGFFNYTIASMRRQSSYTADQETTEIVDAVLDEDGR